jgi:hypothetical protein
MVLQRVSEGSGYGVGDGIKCDVYGVMMMAVVSSGSSDTGT